MSETYKNFIGGEWTESVSGATLANLNPADRTDIVGYFPNSDAADAENALAAATNAQAGWAALAAPARGEFLRKAADRLEARADTVARDLSREEGKSLPEAKGETMRGVTLLRYYAQETMRPDGEVIPSAFPQTLLFTRRIPLGVVSLITPWNFPIAIPLWKAAPALAFGNTVVMKPSEHAPLTAWHIAECFAEAGLPKGVFNLVFGEGTRTGETLVTHSAVSGISFTGSARTGKTIAALASAHSKKYQMEMGGKNAAVVLPDADMEQAVTLTVQGAFKSAGEKCTATSRVIVHNDCYDAFTARLVERTKSLRIGPGDDSAAYLGPVISEAAQANILRAVREATDSGIALLCGGTAPDDSALQNGFYVQPTLFGDVPPNAPIAQEEVFGPVLCVLRAESTDQALTLLNGVAYGLSASLFTSDLNAALTFAERAQVGMVRINGETAGVEPQAPFGGMKASSSFSREQGQAARDFFTQIKTISVDRAG